MRSNITQAMEEFQLQLEAERIKFASRIRPLVFEQFRTFFADYPEIGAIKFRVATDIYDDENYSEGVEYVQYRLRDDLSNVGFEYAGEGVLHGMYQSTRDEAAGKFRDYQMRHYTIAERNALQQSAIESLEGWNAFLEVIGGESRVETLNDAVKGIEGMLRDIDIDFHKIVFGEDVTVIITKEGFKIEQ
jgi:hypothetical protein